MMIKFNAVYDQYQPGDVASLEPTLMRRLVALGTAEVYFDAKPPAPPEPEPKPVKKKETATSKRAVKRKKAVK